MRTEIDSELRTELAAIAESVGCELDQIEFTGGVLRIVLDREDEAVTVDDCATVSRQVSALLDVVDFGTDHYTLEVSSPGLDRPLERPADYERFVGRLARLTFRPEAETTKRTVVGRLESYEPDHGGVVTLEIADGDEHLRLPLERIDRARLEIEL